MPDAPATPAAAPVAANATAEHEAAGGDFDAAMAAAIADDTSDGVTTDQATAGDVNAPEPGAEPVEAKPDDDDKTPKVEPKKPDEPTEPAKLRVAIEAEVRQKLRGDFTALARDRGKLRDREAAVAAKETAAESHVQKSRNFDVLSSRLLAGDVSVLRELAGADADAVINKLLDGVIASEKSPAEREVERMRAELKARDDKAVVAEQERQVAQWQAQVRSAVEAAGETFDLVNSLGQHEAVIATIEAYYAKYNTVLPVEDAAQVIEDTLAKGLAKSKKFGARAPATNAQPSKGNPAPSAKKGGSVTLSSVPTSEVPSGEGDDLPLDPEKRFRALMASV